MTGFWNFIQNKSNRDRLAWLGGGAVVVIAGLWTAFIYFYPSKHDEHHDAGNAVANCGGIAVGGNVTGSTITTGQATDPNCH